MIKTTQIWLTGLPVEKLIVLFEVTLQKVTIIFEIQTFLYHMVYTTF